GRRGDARRPRPGEGARGGCQGRVPGEGAGGGCRGRVPGEGARGGPRDLATAAGTAFHAGADRSRLKPLLRSGCCRSPSRSNRTRAVGAAAGRRAIRRPWDNALPVAQVLVFVRNPVAWNAVS